MLYAEICPKVRRHNARPGKKSMLYAEICPKVRRHNARPGGPKYVPRLEGIMHDPEGECIMPSNLGTYFGI
jgi:hypothetical protein